MAHMKIRTLLLAASLPLACLCTSNAALAQSIDEVLPQLDRKEKSSLEGSWALKLDGTIIFRFDLERDGGKWSGTWLRPDSFASNGNAFARLKGEVESVPSMAGLNFAGMVELSFDDPRPNAIPDIFRFRLENDDAAQLTYVGTDLAPYALVRVDQDSEMGDWDEAAVYRRSVADEGMKMSAPTVTKTDESAVPAEKSVSAGPRIKADFLEGL